MRRIPPLFRWQERRPVLQEGIFCVPVENPHLPVPPYSFSFPGWESPLVFGNANPVCVEYCSGNGTWLAQRAETLPTMNWVGVDIQWSRVQKIYSKISRQNLKNCLAVCADGLDVTERYFPTHSVDAVYINFPDPWPKKRHAKNRIISNPFLDHLSRILKPGKVVTFVTDDPDYSDLTIETFLAHPSFEPLDRHPHFIDTLPGYGTSFFEELWREKGKTIRYHRFQTK